MRDRFCRYVPIAWRRKLGSHGYDPGWNTYGIEVCLPCRTSHEVVEILRLRVFLTSVGRLTVVYVATGDRCVFSGVFIKLPKSAAPIPQPIFAIYKAYRWGATCPNPATVKLGRIVRAAALWLPSQGNSLLEIPVGQDCLFTSFINLHIMINN